MRLDQAKATAAVYRSAHGLAAFVSLALVALGCEDPARAVRPADASAPKPASAKVREGCARSGALDAIEADPSCVVKQAGDDTMRAVLKYLSISLNIDPSDVIAGSSSLLELTIKNVSSSEVTLYFEARSRPPGLRPDWSRVAGIPEPQPNAPEANRLFFPVTTTDGHDRDVDAVPTVAGSGATSSPTLLAVHLRPGAKLARSIPWWALSIPAPAPIVKDDAGHRYVPKTVALPLYPGSYKITVELPFHGLEREERKVSTHVRVERAPALDGGVRR